MRKFLVRATAFVVCGTLLAAFLTGCTLTGAPAPGTPVSGDTGGGLPITQEATQQTLPPTPTPIGPIDVFATQTAQAAVVVTQEPLPGTGTEEPGGEVTEEATEAFVTPTPQIQTTPLATTAAGGQPGECPATYTVQSGDNLFRIAMRFGITWQELAAANGITNPESLQVGQVLTIPGCQGQSSGGTTGTPTAPSGGEETYTVQAGDNLFRIALKYGITWQELAAYNNITDPTSIYPGQVLKIPPH